MIEQAHCKTQQAQQALHSIAPFVQVDNFVIGYLACLQEVRKGIDAVAPGASLTSPMQPQQVAAVAQLLCKVLAEKDSPILSASKLQVRVWGVQLACVRKCLQRWACRRWLTRPEEAHSRQLCLLVQVLMEVAFKQQREAVEREQSDRAERIGAEGRGGCSHACFPASTCIPYLLLHCAQLLASWISTENPYNNLSMPTWPLVICSGGGTQAAQGQLSSASL